jgi:Plasmid pRiA4b ORF-3-like protein/Transposase
MELFTGAPGRHRGPDELKALIVLESLAPDAVVTQVAQRHGCQPQQIHDWRGIDELMPWAAAFKSGGAAEQERSAAWASPGPPSAWRWRSIASSRRWCAGSSFRWQTIRLDRLHLTLQAAFGWTNTHLYAFTAGGIDWGIPDPHVPTGDQPVDARKARLYDIVRDTGAKTIRYLYDFGDDWQHVIKLERWFENTDTAGMPFLLEASGRCPPEDIGGPGGYAAFLAAPRRRISPRPCRSTGNGSGRLRSRDSRSGQAGTPGRRTRTKMATALRAQVTRVKSDPARPRSTALMSSAF